jgi:hypothetical protein
VTWQGPCGDVKLVQKTAYPAEETSTLSLEMGAPAQFSLRFRVPEWAAGATATVNGAAFPVEARPGSWAQIARTWASGDSVQIRIPMTLKMAPVDRQHPRRVAVVRGPVVLVMDDWVFEEIPRLPEPDDLDKWLVADEKPGIFRIADADGRKLQAKFRPFYAVGEVTPYRMYHDLDAPPIPVW